MIPRVLLEVRIRSDPVALPIKMMISSVTARRFARVSSLSALILSAFPLTASAFPDLDGDGMDDVWVRQYGLTLIDLNGDGVHDLWAGKHPVPIADLPRAETGPSADPDHDGRDNLTESFLGTNPLAPDPVDFPQVHLAADAVHASVSWPSVIGKLYTLRIASDIAPQTWRELGEPIAGNGGNIEIQTAIPDDPTLRTRQLWNLKVEDVDQDNDGLSDYEEEWLHTNPRITDSDGDGYSDGEEVTGRREPKPKTSATATAINTPGHPQWEMGAGETYTFLFSIANPGGPDPVTSDLTLLVNGVATPARFTALSDSRFDLTWTAVPPTDPDVLLQNLVVKFEDVNHTKVLLRLAQIDVAEWKGRIAESITPPGPRLYVRSHSGGDTRLLPLQGLYRGPATMPLFYKDGSSAGVTVKLDPAMRYPMIFLSSRAPAPLKLDDIIDISDPIAYPDNGRWFRNATASNVRVTLGTGIFTLNPGETQFHALPPLEENGPRHIAVQYTLLKPDGEVPLNSEIWSLRKPQNQRILRLVEIREPPAASENPGK